MNIERKDKFIYITNGNLKIVLSCLGASIVEISFDNDLLTLTPVNYSDLNREDIYYGKNIGPIANRIKDGLVEIDNRKYYLPLNEKGVCNHSGKAGLSNKLFDAKIEDDKVIFTYKDSIFDSIVIYKVIYSFLENNEIRIDYEVKTSNKAVLSLTNHTFFTLGEDGIDNLSLRISSDKFIESDKDTLVPLRIKPIIDCLDFNKAKLITKDINDPYLMNHRTKGYDHCFLLKENKVELSSNKYHLEIIGDYPCVHIYSDNYSDSVINKNSHLSSHRGVAIEPEDNLLNKPMINKDEIYQRYITYKFSR